MRGVGIGGGGGEIAAHREEHLAAPVQHRFDRTNAVETVLARRLEAAYLLQPVQECRRWPLADAHPAIALHVAVAAHRAGACPRPAEVAAAQQPVAPHLARRDRIFLTSAAHGPPAFHPGRTPVSTAPF